MENFYEDWQTMPDEDLKRIYTGLKKKQRRHAVVSWIILLPALLVYGMIGWITFFVAEFGLFRGGASNAACGMLFFILLAVCGVFFNFDNERQLRPVLFIMPVGGVLIFLLFGMISPLPFIMEVYVVIVYIKLRKLLKDLNFLRSLPSFPFEGMMLENMTVSRKTAIKQLEQVHKGAYAPDYEKIFTSDKPEEIVSPPEKKEEYFQQHRWLG